MKDENGRDGNTVTMPNTTKSELFNGQKEKFKKETFINSNYNNARLR